MWREERGTGLEKTTICTPVCFTAADVALLSRGCGWATGKGWLVEGRWGAAGSIDLLASGGINNVTPGGLVCIFDDRLVGRAGWFGCGGHCVDFCRWVGKSVTIPIRGQEGTQRQPSRVVSRERSAVLDFKAVCPGDWAHKVVRSFLKMERARHLKRNRLPPHGLGSLFRSPIVFIFRVLVRSGKNGRFERS